LDLNEPGCDASGRLNSTPIADECSLNTGPTFPDGTTCEPSPAKDSSGPTLSAAGSHARISAMPDERKELKESGPGCGQSSRVSFAFYDRDTSSWRTCQRSLIEGLDEFSETWPRAGTMRNGVAFGLATWDWLTAETDSLLLPTPTARDVHGHTITSSRPDGFTTVLPNEFKKLHQGPGQCYPVPSFVEEVMGFPRGWTELKDSETPSSPKSPNGSAKD
jgi:hypothetical protein